MKFILFCVALLLPGAAFCQQAIPDITGTWKALSKVETKTTAGTVTGLDKEMYKTREKTYTFTATTVTITQGFGKHSEKLPLRVQSNQLFIGKPEKNKQPYVLSVSDKRLILTKTERKVKKGKTRIDTEVVTLEK
ncbi:hypothetical protein SNE25_11235 [Mucilaginibacter sabulilitoris]|uniref:Lipocalin-like domain-containing protein n=1 Tax=Mucilaginibacter sabulilitoris TaxID=1173583 RepID=A0ABZ0TWA1_9SPHI|nr:hypothetical protein [Mucilaginibacter sabulilitoris]WPU96094.1 hypothetical protein SNE25_11235 [Mucilaginibacter sabulilitoris]